MCGERAIGRVQPLEVKGTAIGGRIEEGKSRRNLETVGGLLLLSLLVGTWHLKLGSLVFLNMSRVMGQEDGDLE